MTRSTPRRPMMTSLVVAAALHLAACGEDRPRIDEWRAQWESTRDLVPDEAAIEDEGADVCGTFLGEVRERRAELTPAPTETVERAFDDWVEKAEALGLDCAEGTEDLDARLAEVDRLAERVEAALGG